MSGRAVSRRAVAAAVGSALAGGLLAGCSTGTNAVDQGAGSGNRYVAGNGKTTSVAAADRHDAAQITGTTLEGRSFRLSSLRGQVVVLNFWASWCAPCRAEAGDLESVSRQTKASGVAFVGVDVRDQHDSAMAFQRTFHVSYPSLYDRSDRVALQLKGAPPNSTPFTVVLDRRGRIAVVIRRSVRAAELLPVVRQVAAEAA